MTNATKGILLIAVVAVIIFVVWKVAGGVKETAELTAQASPVKCRDGSTQSVESLSEGSKRTMYQGDGVNVEEQGRAELKIAGCYLDILQESSIKWIVSDNPQPPVCTVSISHGTITATVTKTMRIETEWCEICTLGTKLLVHVDGARGLVWVIVQEGKVEVVADSNRVVVGPGQQTWVRRDGQIEPVRPATRREVGKLFPPLETLTNDAVEDREWLAESDATELPPPLPTLPTSVTPRPAADATATDTHTPTNTPTYTPTDTPTTTPTHTLTNTPSQTPRGPTEIPVATGPGHQLYPAVACNTDRDEYLVVWQEGLESADIYAQLVSSSGRLRGSQIRVSTEAEKQVRPAVAYNVNRNEYLVVWQSGTDHTETTCGRNHIYAHRLSADGALLGNVIPIARATDCQVEPDVAYNSSPSDEYLVVWRDGAVNVHGRRISGSGSLLGDSFPICTANRQQNAPSVAYNSRDYEYLVVWDDFRNNQHYDIYGRRLSATGSLVGSEDIAICTTDGRQDKPQVGYCPVQNEYLVAWPDYGVESTGLYPGLYAARINADDSVREFALSTAQWGQSAPSIAFESLAGEYVVVWANTEPGDVRGQRLSADGSLLGGELAICNAQGKQHLPVIAANTELGGYIVAWEDYRNTDLGYDSDIYAYLK